MAKHGDPTEEDSSTQILRRDEQDRVDRIIHGEEPGHYFMLLGPKARFLFALPKISTDQLIVGLRKGHDDL